MPSIHLLVLNYMSGITNCNCNLYYYLHLTVFLIRLLLSPALIFLFCFPVYILFYMTINSNVLILMS